MNIITLDNGLKAFDHNGVPRVLAALKPPATYQFPNFGDNFGVIDPSKWTEKSMRHWNVPILDQGQHGSCTGHGTASAAMRVMVLDGHPLVLLSPTMVYAMVNGGQDNGAAVHDAANVLATTGICTMAEFGEDKIYRQQIPLTAFQTAKRFRAKIFKLNNVTEFGSALELDFPVISGIAVGANFSRYNGEFVVPLPNTIEGGHCTCQMGKKKSAQYGWVFEGANSWGTSWGDQGYFYLQPAHFDAKYGYGFDCLAVQVFWSDPLDPDAPPVVIG